MGDPEDQDFSMQWFIKGKKYPLRKEKIGVYALGTGIAKGPYERSAHYLQNYYEKYDIPMYVAKEDDERVWGTFHKLKDGGINWWHAAVTCRWQLLHKFLETDQEYFILQDLDYVVINEDINIRECLPDFVCPNWIYKPEYWRQRPICRRKHKIQTEILEAYDPNMTYEPMRHVCGDFIGMTRLEVENMMAFYKQVGVDTSNTDEFAAWCCERANALEDVECKGWANHMQEEELFASYIAAKNLKPTKIEKTPIRMDCWWMSGAPIGDWLKEVVKLTHALREPRHAFMHFGGCDKIKFFDKVLDLFQC